MNDQFAWLYRGAQILVWTMCAVAFIWLLADILPAISTGFVGNSFGKLLADLLFPVLPLWLYGSYAVAYGLPRWRRSLPGITQRTEWRRALWHGLPADVPLASNQPSPAEATTTLPIAIELRTNWGRVALYSLFLDAVFVGGSLARTVLQQGAPGLASGAIPFSLAAFCPGNRLYERSVG